MPLQPIVCGWSQQDRPLIDHARLLHSSPNTAYPFPPPCGLKLSYNTLMGSAI